MDFLWAPWRMEYIGTARDDSQCIFCSKPMENDDKKNLIAYRGKTCYIILNYYPYNNGHLMIVPYRHFSEFNQLTVEEKLEIMNLTEQATLIIKAEMSAQGFNIGVNLGSVAGAGIAQHLHFHVVPRWNGDTNFMPVTSHTKVISEGLMDTCERLRKHFRKEP